MLSSRVLTRPRPRFAKLVEHTHDAREAGRLPPRTVCHAIRGVHHEFKIAPAHNRAVGHKPLEYWIGKFLRFLGKLGPVGARHLELTHVRVKTLWLLLLGKSCRCA